MKTQLVQTYKPLQQYSLKQVQSLAVLSMNMNELENKISSIAEENPVLEILPTYYTRYNQLLDENIATSEPTLTDELLAQCNTSKFEHKEVARYLIQCLDSNGYLTTPLTALRKECHVSMDILKKSLAYIQTLSPKGVGARDMQECLEIQCRLIKTKHHDLLMKTLHYLPDLAKGHFQKVAQLCDVNEADVRKCFELIKTCNPKPGASYAQGATPLISDIEVTLEDDQLLIQIHDITQSLQLNKDFDTSFDKEAANYIKQQTKLVKQLLNSIQRRNTTLYEVCRIIIEIQKDYFIDNAPLKVMTYQQIAELVNRHTSTVFRCIQNKALLFNNQTILLSTLFTNEVNDGVSDDTIKKELKRVIQSEDKKSPLSDEQLCSHFRELHIQVSRRTLAKYREQLRIPNSMQRKVIF
ncbi:MAG: RNA polymerase factor sigma-54 [Anaerorhabdus sp.]|uniref:RNA polymerase factor sigma-54 n=1 Tax=Anaerorhabdus sp. TaxID=1872524 RepID=UPI003A8BA25F